MEELLKALMDRGFLIYRYETDPPPSLAMPRPKFVLKKIRTPADSRPFDLGDGDDTLIEYFASFEEALDKAKKMIDWQPKKTVTGRSIEHGWMLELMYRHKGLGPKFVDLGEMKPSSYEIALADAKLRAVDHINEFLNEDNIEGWDVKIRPYNKNSTTRKNGLPSRQRVHEILKDHSRKLQGG